MGTKLCKQIDLGINPITGKRVRKRIYANSKAELDRKIKEAMINYGKHGIPSDLTFGEYRDKWLKAYCSNITPSTLANYKTILKHASAINSIKMSNIIQADLQELINNVLDRPATAEKLATMLHTIWTAAIVDGVVEKNVALKLKKPKRKKSNRRAFTPDELKAIQSTKFNEQEQLLVNILRQFGLRPGEALALKVSDFNKKDLTLTINKAVAYKKEAPYIKSTKTEETRVIPCPAKFFKMLPKNTLFLFTYDGELLTKKRKETLCRHICEKVNATMGGNKKLKVTPMTCYFFRHHKATELYYMQKEGVTLKAAAEYLGHSEKMLLEIYSHLDELQENTDVLRKCVI